MTNEYPLVSRNDAKDLNQRAKKPRTKITSDQNDVCYWRILRPSKKLFAKISGAVVDLNSFLAFHSACLLKAIKLNTSGQ